MSENRGLAAKPDPLNDSRFGLGVQGPRGRARGCPAVDLLILGFDERIDRRAGRQGLTTPAGGPLVVAVLPTEAGQAAEGVLVRVTAKRVLEA